MRSWVSRPVFLILFTLCLFVTSASAQEKPSGLWKEFAAADESASQEKFQEALDRSLVVLKKARQQNQSTLVAAAMIKAVQFQLALHGYETAVGFLRTETWPNEPMDRAGLLLFYAETLTTYLNSYEFEVSQREHQGEINKIEIKRWTKKQIASEIRRAYSELLKLGVALDRPLPELMGPFVVKSNYPNEIRPLMRDFVVYMTSQHLSDSSFWTPDQGNQLYRIKWTELLSERLARGAISDVKLMQEGVHPLEILAVLLQTHASLHRRAGRQPAALEAQYELARRMNEAVSEIDDRKVIRGRLAELQKNNRSNSWWSVGQGLLAQMILDENEADSRIRARAEALAGLEAAKKDSHGFRHCRAIVSQIENPDFTLTAMSSDAPNRRSILLTYRNLSRVHVRMYRVPFQERLANSRGQEPSFNVESAAKLIESGVKPAAEWTENLLPTKDYLDHRHFITPRAQKPGHYVVLVSSDGRFDLLDRGDSSVVRGLGFFISDLVLVSVNQGPQDNVIRVLSGESGKPVPGARVQLYRIHWDKQNQLVSDQKTDREGRVQFDVKNLQRHGYGGFLVAANLSDHWAVLANKNFFGVEATPQIGQRLLIFTDRSVYRPGQRIKFKVQAYSGQGDPNDLKALAKSDVSVALYDINQQKVGDVKLKTNSFGSAWGELSIATGRPLGSWRLVAGIGLTDRPAGSQSVIRVEEYKRPTFEVKILESETPMRLNRLAKLTGEARYYFGLPVTNGKVRWRVKRQPVYPMWWFYWGRHSFSPKPVVESTIAQGETPLESDGRFSLSFTPEADERAGRDVSFRFLVEADVTDEGGETRQAQRSVRLGLIAIETVLADAPPVFMRDREMIMNLKRQSLDGTARAGAGEYQLVRLKSPQKTLLPAELNRSVASTPEKTESGSFATPGDRQRARWETDFSWDEITRNWEVGETVRRASIAHNKEGAAEIKFAPGSLAAGAYRLIYKTKDEFGAEFKLERDLLVGDRRVDLALPLILLAEKTSVEVGQTARFLLHSGLKNQPIQIDIYRGYKLVSSRQISSGGDSWFEVPVQAADRGGFQVSVTALRDHQLLSSQVYIMVPWTNKRLDLELISFRDQLRVGAKETFTIAVKGADGQRLGANQAEILAYMYDRSLDLFAAHAPPAALSLYPQRSFGPTLISSLGAISQNIWSGAFSNLFYFEGFVSERLSFFDNYGVGGPGIRGQGGPMFGSSAMMLDAAAPNAAPAPQKAMASRREAVAKEETAASVQASDKDSLESDQAKVEKQPAAEIRSDFSESAFFIPQLLTDDKGQVRIEFTAPESVTAWNFWAHAMTQDMRGGSVMKTTQTFKEIMVRPYLPRFLRQGDRAEIQVVINSAAKEKLSGQLEFEIHDVETGRSALKEFGLRPENVKRAFTLEPQRSQNFSFSVQVPANLKTYSVQVMARSTKGVTDGERRVLPVLPSRMHLTQSRFVTLRDGDRKKLEFKDLQNQTDASRLNEKLVVTIDAQLFLGALRSLPYLLEFPYECVEQTLNRFVSTSILTSLFKKYPGVAKAAQGFSTRPTQFERFDEPDPNRRMALEESPWLQTAQGGISATGEKDDPLMRVLDSRVAKSQRERSLSLLKKMQLGTGAWPWWQGGPADRYMTIYILHGFAKAAEFGESIPEDMALRALRFLKLEYESEWRNWILKNTGWEFITFLNYVLSLYRDPKFSREAFSEADRKQMLDFSFKNWKSHSPYLKGYLALTLHRMGRVADAKLVWSSVMDSAKTTQELGTYWAPEDRSWLWYNDTIETHAFALRTLGEVQPDDKRQDGLVQWLFLNKKLNHWKSTRATAEVIYSLAHYLDRNSALSAREVVRVDLGDQKTEFVFEPDVYSGRKNQIIVDGEKLSTPNAGQVQVEKKGPGLAFASATWHFSTERLPKEESSDFFSVSRSYFVRELKNREYVLRPLQPGDSIRVGDQIEVHLSIRAKHAAEYVHLRDPRGAGFEPESLISGYRWDLGLIRYEETRDSGQNFFFSQVPVGEYTLKYRLRAAVAGRFRVAPATLQSMYAPEFNAYSSGHEISISPSLRNQ